jgi:threonine aldolase
MHVNLYSDTQTRPTPAMREAMASAEVGDEQRRLDPTVEALCERVADLLGQDEAVFLPSGAMCNLVAVATHTQPGDAVFCERDCHITRAEAGGASAVSGVMIESLHIGDGTFTSEHLEERVGHLRLGVYSPPPRLVCVENTHNFAGGTTWPLDRLDGVLAKAKELGLATHLDGARLLNAAVAQDVLPARLAAGFDSVWIDLSKGLGCPMGAVLAGKRDFIAAARRYKQMFGGGLRQAGVVAAAGLYALDHHVDRLAEDHENAKRLADGLRAISSVSLVRPPETNIVFFDVADDAAAFVRRAAEAGVEFSLLHGRVRAVTHLDVHAAGIDYAIDVAKRIVHERS